MSASEKFELEMSMYLLRNKLEKDLIKLHPDSTNIHAVKIFKVQMNTVVEMVMYFLLNPISAGGAGGIHPLQVSFPRHRHKYQPIDSKLSDF